ncbi:MAG: NAD-dependent dihydropyrimidine dehydrogenase subunit PreA, partial [Deltaproteobacteria bacterium]|nr:NAD-dependent dihydropyrimidine dehydrogenase subunit PreA [Deltaproteobacteria bacterium]
MGFRRDLGIDFCGVRFENPVLLSSSPVSNTGEMVGRAFDAGFGGVAFKTICTGDIPIIHPAPRMAGYDCDGRKLVGLQNVEQISDRPLRSNLLDLTYLKKGWPSKVVIASIMGFSRAEWRDLAVACADAGADMLELNFSCPHMAIEGSGMKVGQAFSLLEEYTAIVKAAVSIPVLAKMTPNITDICEPALYAKQGGADGIAAINTVSALVGIGLTDDTPRPNVFGVGAASGYSGPAVKPIGLRCVAQLAGNPALGLPVSGIGGIETWVDAAEFLLCGASTIQLTTGVIHYGYRIVEDLLEGLSYWLEERGFATLEDAVGRALPHIVTPDRFDHSRQGVASYDLDRCVGCGQCRIVCHDAGGQCLTWDPARRRPVMDEARCLGCMICSFVCPVAHPPMISFR